MYKLDLPDLIFGVPEHETGIYGQKPEKTDYVILCFFLVKSLLEDPLESLWGVYGAPSL